VKAFTVIRVSGEDQLRGYGPDSQWADDVVPNAAFLGLEVSESLRSGEVRSYYQRST